MSTLKVSAATEHIIPSRDGAMIGKTARHGLAWYELDHSWILINVLKFFGIAKSIQVAKISTPMADREAA